MMKYFLIASFLICYNFVIACSLVCGIPSKFDTKNYILEGKVIGYVGNFKKSDISGEFSGLVVKVTKTIYAPQPVKTFNLFRFGLGSMCEDTGTPKEYLMKEVPLGSYITVIGNFMEFKEIEGLNIRNYVCTEQATFYSKIKEKSNFSFEKDRIREINIRKKVQAYQKENSGSYYELYEHFAREDQPEIPNEKKFPHLFQAYLELLAIHKTKDEKQRFEILQDLIWFHYISDKRFIDDQDINEDMKAALKLKFEEIQKEWAYY